MTVCSTILEFHLIQLALEGLVTGLRAAGRCFCEADDAGFPWSQGERHLDGAVLLLGDYRDALAAFGNELLGKLCFCKERGGVDRIVALVDEEVDGFAEAVSFAGAQRRAAGLRFGAAVRPVCRR